MAMSTKLSVATHILVLIQNGPPELVTSEYLAASINTNPVVVRRLMSQLKKAGLIYAAPGMSQNRLAKPDDQISLYDIYQAVELEQEFFNIHKNPNPDCLVGKNIQGVLEDQYQQVQQVMEEELKTITLAKVTKEILAKQET